MVYKDFKVDNRASVSRTNVHIKVTVPFHSGELPRNTAGDPIQDLRQNYSLRINNQIYDTSWTEFGAPWFADENNNGGFIRFATAECIVPVFPPGELDGDVVLNQNTEPTYQMHPAIQNALFPADPNNPDFRLEALFSGDITKPARIQTLSGTSTGWFSDTLFPLRQGNNSNTVAVYQEGLRTIVKAETWLGAEVHPLGHQGTVVNNRFVPPVNARYVTGFCHVRFWGEIASQSPDMHFTFAFCNDKLNNPTFVRPNGEHEVIYDANALEGKFFLNFSGDPSIECHSFVKWNNAAQIATGSQADGNYWEMNVDYIPDAQCWGHKGVISFESNARGARERDFAINCGLPTYETWSGVNGPEYPIALDLDSSTIRSIHNEGRARYNSWNTTPLLPWEPLYRKSSAGVAIGLNSTSFQARFGKINNISQPFVPYGTSQWGLEAVSISNIRLLFSKIGHFYGLEYKEPRLENQEFTVRVGGGDFSRNPGNSIPSDRITCWRYHDPISVAIYGEYDRQSSLGTGTFSLGRLRQAHGTITPAINHGNMQRFGWSATRTQHTGITPAFLEALMTRDPYLIDMIREEYIRNRCATPKYGAGGIQFSPFGHAELFGGSENGYNATRGVSRPARMMIQWWYLSADPTVKRHLTNRINDMVFGVTEDPENTGTIQRHFPGWRDGLSIANDTNLATYGRDVSVGKLGYHSYDTGRICYAGVTGDISNGVVFRDTTCTSRGTFNVYPPAGTAVWWKQPPIGGLGYDTAAFMPRLRFPWQDGMIGSVLASIEREGWGDDISGNKIAARDFLEDFYDFAYVRQVPRSQWIWQPVGPGFPGVTTCPWFKKGHTASFGISGAGGGPNYVGQNVYSNDQGTERDWSHEGITYWSYAGWKSYTLFYNPQTEPVRYAQLQEVVEAHDFVYRNHLQQNKRDDYYVGDWNWSPGGVIQNRGPRVDFTGAPITGAPPLTVTFTDLTLDNPTTWNWDFDADGTIESTQQNPSYTYTGDGLYSVALTASNTSGVTRLVKPNYILVTSPPTPPVVDFTGDPISGEAPLTVQFTDLTTNSPTSWEWELNPFGARSVQQNPIITYTSPGFKSITLTAVNNDGTGRLTKTNYINVTSPNNPPVADFIANPTAGNSPLTVQFQDRSTNNPTSWVWSFGTDDLEFSTEQNPTVTYPNTGVFTVSLRAINQYGEDTLTRQNYITVTRFQTLIADFEATPRVGIAPLTVQFTNRSTPANAIDNYEWHFGESPLGTIDSTAENPTYTYTTSGQKTVELTISNSTFSVFNRKVGYIRVDQPGIILPPVADFTAFPRTGVTPFNVQFTDLSLPAGTVTGWAWNFIDGDVDNTVHSTQQNPIYQYSGEGIYDVALKATNRAGSTTAIKLQYIVGEGASDNPVPLFEADAIYGPIPHTVHFVDTTSGTITGRHWYLKENYDTYDATGEIATYVYTVQKALPGYNTRLIAYNSSGVYGTGDLVNHINVANVPDVSPDLIFDYSIAKIGNVYHQNANTSNVQFDNLFTVTPYTISDASPDSNTTGAAVYGISGNRKSTIFNVNFTNNNKIRTPSNAYLNLFIDSVTGSGDATEYKDMTINVYRVPWSIEEPTWNEKEPGISWTSSGASANNQDRTETILGSFQIPSSYANSSIQTIRRRIDIDVSPHFIKGVFDKQFSILLEQDQSTDTYSNIGVNFLDDATLGFKYVDVQHATFQGTGVSISNTLETGQFSNIRVESDETYGDAYKSLIQFNLGNTFFTFDTIQVAAAFVSLPLIESPTFYGGPALYRTKFGVDLNTVSWSGYSGSSAWSGAGATGTSDVISGPIYPFIESTISGVYSGSYSGNPYVMDSITYDVTTDLQNMIAAGYDAGANPKVTYLASYDDAAFSVPSGEYIYGANNSTYYPRLTVAGIFTFGPRGGGAVGVDPTTGGGGQPSLSGSIFSIWYPDSNGEFTTDSTLFSGYMYQLTGEAEDGGITNAYQKLYILNDSESPLFNIELKMISKYPSQLFLAYEKEAGDNTSNIYTMPSGYSRSDFNKSNSPNGSLRLGNLDTSGYTGFWINMRIPENFETYSTAWIEPSVKFNTIISQI